MSYDYYVFLEKSISFAFRESGMPSVAISAIAHRRENEEGKRGCLMNQSMHCGRERMWSDLLKPSLQLS